MILKNGKRIDGCTDTLPVGTVQPFLGLTPPLGYLVCQGQLVSKVEYPELYRICGSTFGTETATHFYLPDLRGKTIAGYDEDDTTLNTIGKLLGSITHTHTTGNHTLTTAEMPEHNHLIWANLQSDRLNGNPSWNAVVTANDEGTGITGGNIGTQKWSNSTNNAQLYIHDYSNSTGGSQAHNHGNTGEATNFQPTLVLNWIVKAVMLIPEYFIVENTLASTSATNALSAAQGRVLNNKFASYLPLSGGTLSGKLILGQGDANCIQLGTDGRINATVGTDTAATVLGMINGTVYSGTTVAVLNLRGSSASPNYNGVPLIQSGSNSNGSYIKFFDGTMICRCRVTKTVTMNTEYGSVYGANFGGITFPEAFTDIPTVTWGLRNVNNTRGCWIGTYNGVSISTTGIDGLHLFRHNANEVASDMEVHVTAIGSWK